MLHGKTEAYDALCTLYELANGITHELVVFDTFVNAVGKDPSELENILRFLESRDLIILDYDGTNEIQFVLLSDSGGPEAERFMNEKEAKGDGIPNGVDYTSNIDVFISHGSQDRSLASALIRLIERSLGVQSNRIRCTSVPGYGLESGDLTETAIRQEIVGARAFIGLLTPSSIGSSYVLFELGARWGADRRLRPLLARGANYDSLPGPLKERTAILASSRTDLQDMLHGLAIEIEHDLQRASVFDAQLSDLVELASQASNERVPGVELAEVSDLPSDVLTREAEDLLLEACEDSNGHIMRTRSSSGLSIQTNGKAFKGSNTFEEAKYDEAFDLLIEHELIKDLAKGSGYRVTANGFRVGKMIQRA